MLPSPISSIFIFWNKSFLLIIWFFVSVIKTPQQMIRSRIYVLSYNDQQKIASWRYQFYIEAKNTLGCMEWLWQTFVFIFNVSVLHPYSGTEFQNRFFLIDTHYVRLISFIWMFWISICLYFVYFFDKLLSLFHIICLLLFFQPKKK